MSTEQAGNQANFELGEERQSVTYETPPVIDTLLQSGRWQGSAGPGIVSVRGLRRGQHLYRCGDAPKYIFFIQHGSCKTYFTSRDGHEQITGFHSAGKLLGLDSLVGHQMRSGAVALSEVSVVQILADTAMSNAGQSSRLRTQLLEALYDNIMRLEADLSVHNFTAPRRLANFIVRTIVDSVEANLPMSHKEIGNYLRLTPETVSRVFGGFQRRGWLATHGHRVTIHDRASLEKVAAGRLRVDRYGNPVNGHSRD